MGPDARIGATAEAKLGGGRRLGLSKPGPSCGVHVPLHISCAPCISVHPNRRLGSPLSSNCDAGGPAPGHGPECHILGGENDTSLGGSTSCAGSATVQRATAA